jgi:hypothetical protein
MKEVWKGVPGYKEKYQVSNLGGLRDIKKNCNCKTHLFGRNVYYLHSKIGFVHRLVAFAFIPNPENKPEVDHIDFNPLNNKVNNLRWVTHKENQQHSAKNISFGKQGEKHFNAKLTDKDVIKIRGLRKNKVRHKVIASMFGISENNSRCVATRGWSHLK